MAAPRSMEGVDMLLALAASASPAAMEAPTPAAAPALDASFQPGERSTAKGGCSLERSMSVEMLPGGLLGTPVTPQVSLSATPVCGKLAPVKILGGLWLSVGSSCRCRLRCWAHRAV